MSDHPHVPDDQPTPGPEPKTTIDELKLRHLMEQLRVDQSLPLALFGGFFGALIGACAWAALTYYTGWQSGIVAIGLGFLVGFTVRKLGKGIDKSFGVVGAVMALVGIVSGNLLVACVYIAEETGNAILDVVAGLDLETAGTILTETFSPVDLIFYGLAVYYAYKYSIRPMTEEELKSVLRPV